MTQIITLALEGERSSPPHSDQCFTSVDYLCSECYWLLAPVPISRRRRVWLEHQRKSRGQPAPLPDDFLDRLAADMAANPHRFAAIIQFLNNYKGVS